jgi:hypothetical protein
MKYNLAKELTSVASQILHEMTKKVFGDSSKFARIFSRIVGIFTSKSGTDAPEEIASV